jgi:uncharacterized protein YggE
MRSAVFVFIALALSLGLFGCAHQGAGSTMVLREDASGVSVVGEGRAEARPDRAVFRIGVEVHRPTVEEARGRAAEALAAMIASLRAAGVGDDDIQTTTLSVSPDYEYSESGRRLLGYVAQNIVTARMTTLDQVGPTIDAAIAAGGDDVRLDGLHFELIDPEALRGEARTKAVENARVHAQQLAQAAGVELGEPVSISETSGSQPGPVMMRMEAARSDAAAPPTPIEPGVTEAVVQVNVRYTIVR